MSVTLASVLRRAALALVAGVAIATPMAAKASLTDGLSIRVGGFFPSTSGARTLVRTAAWGGGIEYKVPWFPKVFNGEHWSTSLSADLHYSETRDGILRYIPVSINQVYSFEEQNGHVPYAGFALTAATFGTTPGPSGAVGRQPMITRLGGGVILGINFTRSLYVEGRYEWFDKHGSIVNPEGFRGYLGWRF